jgi:hypothetical protein
MALPWGADQAQQPHAVVVWASAGSSGGSNRNQPGEHPPNSWRSRMSLSPTVEAAAAAAGSGRRPSVFLRPPASADRAGRRRNPPTRLGRGHHLFGMRFGLPGLGGPAAPWGRGPSASKRLEWRPSFRSSSHGPSFEPTGTHQLELRIRLNCQDDTRQDAGHGLPAVLSRWRSGRPLITARPASLCRCAARLPAGPGSDVLSISPTLVRRPGSAWVRTRSASGAQVDRKEARRAGDDDD